MQVLIIYEVLSSSLSRTLPVYPFEHYNVASILFKYTDEEYTELLEGTRTPFATPSRLAC